VEEERVKKIASALIIITVATIILLSISCNVKTVKANADYTIEKVTHTVEVMYNGYVFINDTITLNITGQAPTSFLIGFPAKYGPVVAKCFASNGSNNYPVTLNVPLEGRVGFYGVRVDFPLGAPEVFSVGFILSNAIVVPDPNESTGYYLDFPAYPSLTKVAGTCNASVVLPEGASYVGGDVPGFVYSKENLQEFTHSPANLGFMVAEGKIQIIDVTDLDREVTINEFGDIEGGDTYAITNKASRAVSSVEVSLPLNASNVIAQDQFGRTMSTPNLTDASTNRYLIGFTPSVEEGRSTRFTLKYDLPSESLTQGGANNYELEFASFNNLNYYINQTAFTLVLPEGARVDHVKDNLANTTYAISRGVFQESVTVSRQGLVALENFSIFLAYEYNPLWFSFRPTLWVWAVAIVGSVIFAIAWKQPKGPTRVSVSTVVTRLRPEHLKAFVDAYEEKKKIDLEMESLEAKVQKGRIPRRRYKVRRKTLEARLDTLSRSLTELSEKMRASGGHYSDMTLQLEIAESEIKEAKAGAKSIEDLHNRGELSIEAYRRRLADYERRKEKADTTINGILLRLREEIH
jgi:hypothetical protein